MKRTEVWTIINGEGQFILDGVLSKVKKGDVLRISAKAKHSIKAASDLEIIEIQTSSALVEEHIIRIYMTWEEIIENLFR